MRAGWREGKRRLAGLIVGALALANCGCLLVAAGAGAAAGGAGYAYHKGKVCREYPADFADAWAAAQAALRDLGLPVEVIEQNPGMGALSARMLDGEKVRVYVETQPSRVPTEGTVTCVCVRVATFGDEAFSQRLLDQIGRHLVPAVRLEPPGPAPIVTPAKAMLPAQTAPPPLLAPDSSSSGPQK